MDHKSLEALLIDHAWGELPAETSDLLEAYLERDPDAAAEARRMDELFRVVQQATPQPAHCSPPRFPRARLVKERDRRARGSWRRWAHAAALVACLGAGKAMVKHTGFKKQHRLIGFAIIGFYRNALEIAGAKAVKAEYATSIEDDKGYSELILSWNDEE